MWLMMTSSTLSGSTPSRFSPSPTGVMTVRPRLRADRLIEAGVDHEGALVVPDHPDEIVERLQHVVRIAADVVLRGLALMLGVADREDFPDVVAHGILCRLSALSWPGLSRPSRFGEARALPESGSPAPRRLRERPGDDDACRCVLRFLLRAHLHAGALLDGLGKLGEIRVRRRARRAPPPTGCRPPWPPRPGCRSPRPPPGTAARPSPSAPMPKP